MTAYASPREAQNPTKWRPSGVRTQLLSLKKSAQRKTHVKGQTKSVYYFVIRS